MERRYGGDKTNKKNKRIPKGTPWECRRAEGTSFVGSRAGRNCRASSRNSEVNKHSSDRFVV